jgi:hypothetical protein
MLTCLLWWAISAIWSYILIAKCAETGQQLSKELFYFHCQITEGKKCHVTAQTGLSPALKCSQANDKTSC